MPKTGKKVKKSDMISFNGASSLEFCNMGLFIAGGEWIHPQVSVPTHELVFVVKGEVFLEEDGARYELKKGDLLCLKPNTVHGGFRKSENCSFYWVHFFAEGYASLAPYRAKAADFSEAVVLFKELNHLSSLGNREMLRGRANCLRTPPNISACISRKFPVRARSRRNSATMRIIFPACSCKTAGFLSKNL